MKAKLIKRPNGIRWDLYLKKDINMLNTIASSEDGAVGKLSLKNCEAIANGYDLDELAKSVPHTCRNDEDWYKCRAGFIVGFQKALELLGDNKFSEEDVIKAIEIARNGSIQQQHNGYGMPTGSIFVLDDVPSDDIIKSLQQTEWDVEIEMEPYHDGEFVDDGNTHVFKPKFRPALDSDGCLILKRI